ncbi:MAG: protease modulator HflC, partial [Alphaproteobacteria bacterium]|nr:protease modulator HflC [Alphaproteobacteria bacterium]
MSQVKLAAIAIVLGGLAILASSAFFTVGQAQQALVLQFGAPVRVVQEPGLQVKIPFVQNVLYFEKRLLDFDDTPREIVMGDQARIVVDVFARYRIRDPLMFFTAARNEVGMRQRLANAVQSNLQNTFGSAPLGALFNERRAALMRQITEGVVSETRSFGIDVVDVRIMRADLPTDNSYALFARMLTERVREATSERAQGAESAQRIRAEAE